MLFILNRHTRKQRHTRTENLISVIILHASRVAESQAHEKAAHGDGLAAGQSVAVGALAAA